MPANVINMRSRLVFTIVAVLSISFSIAESLQTFPAFIWGSEEHLLSSTKQAGLQALYKVSGPAELAASILGTDTAAKSESKKSLLNETALQSFHQQLVRVIVLGQLSRAELGKSKELAASLDRTIQTAASSVYISDLQSTHGQFLEELKSYPGELVEIGSCAPDSHGLSSESIQSVLEMHSGALTVVICNSNIPDLLEGIQRELQSAKRPFLVLYAGQPEEKSSRPAARSLISTSQANAQDLCDRKCRIQVRLFEVIILLVLLLVALWIGLTMLHILDTPTRFEQEKKETNRHND